MHGYRSTKSYFVWRFRMYVEHHVLIKFAPARWNSFRNVANVRPTNIHWRRDDNEVCRIGDEHNADLPFKEYNNSCKNS